MHARCHALPALIGLFAAACGSGLEPTADVTLTNSRGEEHSRQMAAYLEDEVGQLRIFLADEAHGCGDHELDGSIEIVLPVRRTEGEVEAMTIETEQMRRRVYLHRYVDGRSFSIEGQSGTVVPTETLWSELDGGGMGAVLEVSAWFDVELMDGSRITGELVAGNCAESG